MNKNILKVKIVVLLVKETQYKKIKTLNFIEQNILLLLIIIILIFKNNPKYLILNI
jgi:hypothetical protein